MSVKFNQAVWDKKNMSCITGKYKKEFVEDFKEACKTLGISQSYVFREAMTEAIKEAKLKK